jgi:hypothetical protein
METASIGVGWSTCHGIAYVTMMHDPYSNPLWGAALRRIGNAKAQLQKTGRPQFIILKKILPGDPTISQMSHYVPMWDGLGNILSDIHGKVIDPVIKC